MDIKDLLQRYLTSPVVGKLTSRLQGERKYRLLHNAGSVTSVILSAMLHTRPGFRVVVLDDREEAAYFYNDVLAFADGKKVCFLPSSYRRTIHEARLRRIRRTPQLP